LKELILRNLHNGFLFTTDLAPCQASTILFIAVGLLNGRTERQIWNMSCRRREHCATWTITKSSSAKSTSLLEQQTGLRSNDKDSHPPGHDHFKPEFLKEGRRGDDFMNRTASFLAAMTPKPLKFLKKLYEPFVRTAILSRDGSSERRDE